MSNSLLSSAHLALMANFLESVERTALDNAIARAMADDDCAYLLGRRVGLSLAHSDHQAFFLSGLNQEMPTAEEVAREDALLAEIAAHPLTRDEPPPPPEAAHAEEPLAPRPLFGGNRFPRKFDHDAAKCLRREGVTVSALAKHFDVTEHSISRATKGVRRSKNTAAFSRLDALAMRSAGHPRIAIASHVGATATALSAFFDRYDAVATIAREVA